MVKGRPLKFVSVAGREFHCVGDAAGGRRLGGMNNDLDMNGDNETGRVIQTPTAWMISRQSVQLDDAELDQEFLQGVIDSGEKTAFVFDFGNNCQYAGNGTITGDLELDPMNRTSPLDFSGPGKLKKL